MAMQTQTDRRPRLPARRMATDLAWLALVLSACGSPAPAQQAQVTADTGPEDAVVAAEDAADVLEDAADSQKDAVEAQKDATIASEDAIDADGIAVEVQGDAVVGPQDAADAAEDAADGQKDAPDADLCAGIACPDLPCATQACAPSTGACVPTAKADGTACDDGKKCTLNDACAAGVCSGSAPNCDDGNACTNDSCNASLGCVNTVVKAGTACDDGDACTVSDVCAGMSCGGSAKLWEKTFGAPTQGELETVIAADGGFVATGYQTTLASWGTPVSSSLVVKFDAAGNAVWNQTLGAKDDGTIAVVATSDGYVVATNSIGTLSSDNSLAKIDKAGKLLWLQPYPEKVLDQFYGLVADGSAVVASGDAWNASGIPHGWLQRIDASGAPEWTRIASDGTYQAIASVPGGYAVIGDLAMGGASEIGLFRFDTQGNRLWQRGYDVDSIQPSSIIALPDGFALAGGANQWATTGSWFIRTDTAGNELWRRTYPGTGTFFGAIAVGDGFVLRSESGTTVLRVDGLGNLLTSKDFPGGTGFALATDGTSLLFGGSTPSGLPWLQRTDLFFNTTCVPPCGSLTPTGCDDANPCTADLCDAAHGGCWHVNLADGASCTSGDACQTGQTCSAGVCSGGGEKFFSSSMDFTSITDLWPSAGGFFVAGSSGGLARIARSDVLGKTLWSKDFPQGGSLETFTALAPQPGGGIAAIGQSADATATHSFLVTVDADGAATASQTYGNSWQLAALSPSGVGFAAAGSAAVGANPPDMLLLALDATGAVAWSQTFGGPGEDVAHALVVLPDGFLLAGSTAPSGGWSQGWLVRSDSSGGSIWAETFAEPSPKSAIFSAIATSDGFALAGLTDQNMSWIGRFDANGKLLWRRDLNLNGASGGLVATANGFATLVHFGGWEDQLQRYDGTGTLLGAASIGPTGSILTQSTALYGLADGFALAYGAPGSLALMRTDSFGNASCAASGTCASLPASGCDDANPCTADDCDAVHGGCWHTSLGDGQPCGYASACSAGTCVCAPGFIGVAGGVGTVCAADGPVWGNLPISPTNLTDNGDGTVSDAATGLTWQQASPAASTATWAQASAACVGLNLGGHSDWRLPSLAELSTLIDFSKANPATSNLLQTNVADYWSATPAGTGWWTVNFGFGAEASDAPSAANHARCVRGTTASTSGARFVATANTVGDGWTQLTWQRGVDPQGETVTSAAGYCASLAGGWRLPNIQELRGLVDRSAGSPAIDAASFPATPADWFGASSIAGAPVPDWRVSFADGSSMASAPTASLRVRCVH